MWGKESRRTETPGLYRIPLAAARPVAPTSMRSELPDYTSWQSLDNQALQLFYAKSRCHRRHKIEAQIMAESSTVAVVRVRHDDDEATLRVTNLDDPYHDAWQELLEQWRSTVSDFHREEVTRSDWPVF